MKRHYSLKLESKARGILEKFSSFRINFTTNEMRMLAGSRKVYRYENMRRQQVTNIFTNQSAPTPSS